MWERWRYEIDRALRDAELARDWWYDRDFRAELRADPDVALRRFRLLSEGPVGSSAPQTPQRLGWWERAFGRTLPRQAR